MFHWPTQTELFHFGSRSSLLLYGPVAIFTRQDCSTLFTNWKQSRGHFITRQGVSPIKNQTLNYK